jgi:Predicted thioesterase
LYTAFETEINIRPDDIDMNNHVHNTKYFDFVLAARYIQMDKNYKMSMKEFFDLGYTWVISTSHIDFKRALKLDDEIIVRTQVAEVSGAQCKVNFWIFIKATKKVSAEGYINYTMIFTNSGRPARIPEFIVEKYSI